MGSCQIDGSGGCNQGDCVRPDLSLTSRTTESSLSSNLTLEVRARETKTRTRRFLESELMPAYRSLPFGVTGIKEPPSTQPLQTSRCLPVISLPTESTKVNLPSSIASIVASPIPPTFKTPNSGRRTAWAALTVVRATRSGSGIPRKRNLESVVRRL